MFFEDVNTLYEKYKYCSFWYELSYDDIVDNVGNWVDFTKIIKTNESTYEISHYNSFSKIFANTWESSKPTKHPEASQINVCILMEPQGYEILYSLEPGESVWLYVYVDNLYIPPSRTFSPYFVPSSPMNVIRCMDESNTIKVYLKRGMTPISSGTVGYVGTGKYVNGDEWDVDLERTQVSMDEDGYYFELSTGRDGDEFTVIGSPAYGVDCVYFCGKIVNYKALPTITFNTLYRGNTQTIEVYFDGELIDSKYYDLLYQNQVLTDNKITIGEDVTDLELEIYLKHPEYISTKLKYKLTVDWYTFNNQEELEEALELGLTNLRAGGVHLSNIELNNITLTGSSLKLSNCKLNNVKFNTADIQLFDSKSRFVDCELKQVGIRGYTNKLYLTNSIIDNCDGIQLFFVCNENCIITNNGILKSLIFSDDMITITNNNFDECTPYFGEYYPSTLYLTGEFECRNNRFSQIVEGDDFFFGVALIKTIKDTNIDEFIRFNDISTNISIGGESYTGLFYSYIDDSKLHYKEIP